ncbi:MAG TPA: arsenate reductase ArsC [Candidatus Dormibacteraeota bacterium]|nr:arsenate reductase ArsC [Candidatus Dormibacteraeota bacterium]
MARVLFVCLHNAGRSQMSEAYFQRLAGGRHESRSAGTEPGDHVHGTVVEVMKEEGIDLSGEQPRRLDDELSRWADIVITMGCGDSCPVIPGKRYIDWDLRDPKDLALDEVRAIRDDIELRVGHLVNDLDRAAINR